MNVQWIWPFTLFNLLFKNYHSESYRQPNLKTIHLWFQSRGSLRGCRGTIQYFSNHKLHGQMDVDT